jgi:hypothetical protein
VTGETIYLLEQIDIVAGKTDEYLNALREGYVGAVAKRGMQLCASLRTLPGSGEEGLVLLWSIRGGWGNWRRIVADRHYDKDGLAQWLGVC